MGTAQGSTLGPLLYILYTNDIIKCFNYSERIFFTDGMSLICTGSNIKSIMAKIRVDLSCLYNYFIDNDLSINL